MTLYWLAWYVIAGYARLHPLRTVVQIAAIAIGVALGYAVQLINTSALNEFSSAVRSATGQADAAITGSGQGFDEQLLQRVIAHPAVEVASPQLTVNAAVLDSENTDAPLLTIAGIDAFRAATLSSNLVPGPGADTARFALLDDGIWLAPAALQKFRRNVGDRLRLQVGDGVVALTIVGTLPGAARDQLIGVMDIGFAQWRLGRIGTLNRIDLKLAPGTSLASLAQSLALPPGVLLTGTDAEAMRVSNMSRAYRINLTVLALVALFTGGFLVLSLQAQATIARRSQIAFLRVTGVTMREVQSLMIGEALLLGTIGSSLGLALGAGLATLSLQLLGGDLGSGFFAGAQPQIEYSLTSLVAFFGLGLAAAVAGSWLPARDAARTSPAMALKSGAEEEAYKPLGRAWPGIAILAVAALLVTLPPVDNVPVFGYSAIAAILIGAISLQSRLARLVFEPLAHALERSAAPRPPILMLAVTRIAQAPSFAAIGMAGIVASFSLMIAMATMVASFRDSVDDWLDRILPAQIYVRVAAGASSAFFTTRDLDRIASHPGVARADFSRAIKLQLDPQRAQVTLLVRPIDIADPAASLPLTGPSVKPARDGPPPIWVTEPMVDIYGMRVGSVIELPLAGRLHAFSVAGVWRDYARQFGAIAMRTSDYQGLTGDNTVTDASVWLAPGARAAEVIAGLREQLEAPAVEFAETEEIRQLSLRIFDRSFAVTYVLEFAAIVIGLIGIAATFSSQAIARTREFGMLRHIGLTRRQILQMLAVEGALLTALAIAVGLVTGLVIAVVLIEIINPQSFSWTMDFNAPQGLIITLMVALMSASVATAVVAGRRAVSIDAVRAVSEDW